MIKMTVYCAYLFSFCTFYNKIISILRAQNLFEITFLNCGRTPGQKPFKNKPGFN